MYLIILYDFAGELNCPVVGSVRLWDSVRSKKLTRVEATSALRKNGLLSAFFFHSLLCLVTSLYSSRFILDHRTSLSIFLSSTPSFSSSFLVRVFSSAAYVIARLIAALYSCILVLKELFLNNLFYLHIILYLVFILYIIIILDRLLINKLKYTLQNGHNNILVVHSPILLQQIAHAY